MQAVQGVQTVRARCHPWLHNRASIHVPIPRHPCASLQAAEELPKTRPATFDHAPATPAAAPPPAAPRSGGNEGV